MTLCASLTDRQTKYHCTASCCKQTVNIHRRCMPAIPSCRFVRILFFTNISHCHLEHLEGVASCSDESLIHVSYNIHVGSAGALVVVMATCSVTRYKSLQSLTSLRLGQSLLLMLLCLPQSHCLSVGRSIGIGPLFGWHGNARSAGELKRQTCGADLHSVQ